MISGTSGMFTVVENDEVLEAIRRGDVATVRQFLVVNPGAATARFDGQRTLLHVATDWPGHWPNVGQTIRLLASHGVPLNAGFHGDGRHSETALHWAASSDDLIALDTLLDLGADIEAPGSVIGGGTALSDAVAFRQWNAARRLIERGAFATIWQCAALGLMERLQQYFELDLEPSAEEVTNAFWNACHGGQLEAARYLRGQGAEVDWAGHGGSTPLDRAAQSGNEELVAWLVEQGAKRSKTV